MVNKPPNMAVHGGANQERQGTLFDILQQLSNETLYPVHRLDKATSGLVVLAKSSESAKQLGQTWQQCEKFYCALIFGESQAKIIDRELDGVPATTEIVSSKLLCEVTQISELEIKLGTGRTHQIRRHLKAEQRSIVMDDKYGDFRKNKDFRLKMKARGISVSKRNLFLHAGRLKLTGRKAEYTAEVPRLWKDCVQALGSNSDNLC